MLPKALAIILLLGSFAPHAIWAQPRIGCIDVTSVMSSLQQTIDTEKALQIDREKHIQAINMQYAGMMMALFPEVPKEGAIDPARSKDIFVLKQGIDQAMKKEVLDAKASLTELVATRYLPLMQVLDSAIQIVSAEKGLDTLLYLRRCPPNPWRYAYPTLRMPYMWSEWDRSFKLAITPDPCDEQRTVLAVSKDVINIGPWVLEKVKKWSGY